MADGPGWVRRSMVRVINDDNLDLYLLGSVALVFTVLGATGVSDVKTLSSVVLALLALLAFSQIRSRRLTEQISKAQRHSSTALFASEFPADLIPRRARGRDLLLVGLSMTRTVQGMRSDILGILEAGGRLRVLVLDPADEVLMTVADRRATHRYGPDKLRARITTTLDDLTTLRERTGGRLEVRVSSSIPAAGIHCIDTAGTNGLVCVQHYEYQPSREASPVFTLEPSDGRWYQHFVAEAERLWDAGTEWPLSPSAAAERVRRPVFVDHFGPARDRAIEDAEQLLITGVARNALVSDTYLRLAEKLRAGHGIRFLLIDPDSAAVHTVADRYYYAERTAEGVQRRIQHVLRLLTELKASTDGDLSVRLTSHPIPIGVITTGTALFAEYYTYQTVGESKFVLPPGSSGYEVFRDEAEVLWRNAKAYEL